MNKISVHVRLLCLAALAAVSTPGLADPVQSAKDAWARLQSGESPKSTPVASDGARETWGDAEPARGRASDVDRRSADRLTQRDPSLKPTVAPSRPEQRSDERRVDERTRDERQSAPARRSEPLEDESAPKSRTVAARTRSDTAAAAPRKAATPVRSGRSTEERYYGAQEPEVAAPLARTSSCVNVNRAWEGAAALAERGDDQRAYDAYLRLLSSCTNDKELVGTVYQAQKNLTPAALKQLMQEPVMEAPKLLQAMFALKLQSMYAANKARDAKTALTLSREIRTQVVDLQDAGALEVSGWLEQRARNPRVAEPLFRAALKANRDSDGARQGLVYSLLAQGKVDAAAREAERLEGAAADEVRGDVLVAQARMNLTDGQFTEALKKLDQAERLGLEADDGIIETRAWALKGAGQADKAARLFQPLVAASPENKDLRGGLIDSLYAAHDAKALQRLSVEQTDLGAAAREALARRLDSQGRNTEAAHLRGEKAEGETGGMSAAVGVRSKSGEKGEGRLRETTIPAGEITAKVTDNARVAVSAVRRDLEDGLHSATGVEVRGKAVIQVGNVEVTAGAGASGTAGSTKPTFEGKARLYTEAGSVLEVSASREPVRDSVRSYSGVTIETPTPAGGLQATKVGRVLDTSVAVGGSTVLDEVNRFKLAWSIGGGSASGINSYNNGYYRASVAVTKEFNHPSFSWLNLGPYLSTQSYERDENRFDGQHGGYFSPKSDVNAGLTANAMTVEGGSTLVKANASMGYVSRGLYYGNDSGISIESGVEAAWMLNSHLILGAGVMVRTSPGYNDVGVKVGITVPFDKRSKLSGSDLTPFKAQ